MSKLVYDTYMKNLETHDWVLVKSTRKTENYQYYDDYYSCSKCGAYKVAFTERNSDWVVLSFSHKRWPFLKSDKSDGELITLMYPISGTFIKGDHGITSCSETIMRRALE